MKLEKRGMIPEIEICYEDFGNQAIDAAERYINLEQLVELAKPPEQNNVDYKAFIEKFKKLLTNYPCKLS
jgi:hypothetical protein